MTADLRRFEYPLEPLRGQRQWELEALQAEHGRVVAAIAKATEELARLEALLAASAADAAPQAARLDLEQRTRLLRWLKQLRGAQRAAAEKLESLEAERLEVLARCAAKQREVELLERQRGDCMEEFVLEETGREATEADRDWLSRLRLASGPARDRGANDGGTQ